MVIQSMILADDGWEGYDLSIAIVNRAAENYIDVVVVKKVSLLLEELLKEGVDFRFILLAYHICTGLIYFRIDMKQQSLFHAEISIGSLCSRSENLHCWFIFPQLTKQYALFQLKQIFLNLTRQIHMIT